MLGQRWGATMRRLRRFIWIPLILTTAAFAQTAAPESRDTQTILEAIHDSQTDVRNLGWLFGAYGIGWLILFGYLFQISQKETKLRHRIAELQETIEDRWKKKG